MTAFVVGLSFVANSCKCKSDLTNVAKVKLDENSGSTRNDLIKNIYFVALEEEDIPIIGSIDKVRIINDKIYVADYERSVIAVFDKSGTYLFSVKKTGRGQGEYLSIQSFSVDDKYLYILDTSSNKMYVYDALSGHYVYDLQVQVRAWDFEVLDNGGFIFAYAPMSHSIQQQKSMRYRVIITDSSLKISDRYFEYEKNEYDGFSYRNYFSIDGEYIVYSSLNIDGFTFFNRRDGSLRCTTELSYNHRLDKNDRHDYDYEKTKKYTYATGHTIKCGNICIIPLNVNNSVCNYCFFPEENVIEKGNAYDIPVFGVVASSKPYLIANWETAGVYNAAISRGIPKASSDIESKIEKGYPYLVFYEIEKKYL